jgi:acyl-CoA thioesterase YciA
VRIGTTSITVRVTVEAERLTKIGERVRVTEAEVVYVAVDEKGRKTPIKLPDEKARVESADHTSAPERNVSEV